jgi:uncharacterized protein YjbI with pentapeptide repeats
MSEMLRSPHEVQARIQDGKLQGVLVQEVDLSKHGLAGAHCADATFRRIALHDADATQAVFSRSKFTEISGRKARFDRSIFRGTAFFGSELIEATFRDANMSGSSFFSSRLGNADFTGSRLQSCTFNSCELFGTRFSRSLIINTKFEAQERGNVTLDRADFSNAVIIDCDLMGANLYGANFRNALLIKVDLRHANIAQADFEGARLIDVAVDATQLEPSERRLIERARLDDPWRNHGFMRDVLAAHSPEEMHAMFEYVLRTYVIETAQTTESSDSMAALVQTIKARYDFPELELLRVRNNAVQVRQGLHWYDLGAEVDPRNSAGEASTARPASSRDEAPAARPQAPAQNPPVVAARRPEGGGMEIDEAPKPAPKPNTPPPKVEPSNWFSNLEID